MRMCFEYLNTFHSLSQRKHPNINFYHSTGRICARVWMIRNAGTRIFFSPHFSLSAWNMFLSPIKTRDGEGNESEIGYKRHWYSVCAIETSRMPIPDFGAPARTQSDLIHEYVSSSLVLYAFSTTALAISTADAASDGVFFRIEGPHLSIYVLFLHIPNVKD